MLPVLEFTTYYKPVVWGGDRIARFKGIPSQGHDIGESWEISPLPGHESIVAAGPYAGITLNALVAKFPEEILGNKVHERYNGQFPLLVKIIDSNKDLSVQVHPDDNLASTRHNANGKTEMWYCVDPAPGAFLYLGFNRPMDPTTLRQMIANNSLVDALGKFHIRRGDTVYIPSGRIHAIGAGNLIVEIQQASDITYRLYDYGRRDFDGKLRDLHIEDSIEAIRYDDIAELPSNIIPEKGESAHLLTCEYFTTSIRDIDGRLNLDLHALDSFTILMAIAGSLTVKTPDGHTTTLDQGHTVLVPAVIPSVEITGHGQVLTVNI